MQVHTIASVKDQISAAERRWFRWKCDRQTDKQVHQLRTDASRRMVSRDPRTEVTKFGE